MTPSADAALSDFRRFPAWMWRNQDVAALRRVAPRPQRLAPPPGDEGPLLRPRPLQPAGVDRGGHRLPRSRRPGRSASGARAVLRASTTSAPRGRPTATRSAYQGAPPCENEVVAQLIELRRRSEAYLRRDGWIAEDEQFFAEQNARVVRDAEEYYQQMYRAEVSSWNLRDRHMAATLDALIDHLDRQFGHAKVVVWEHNSHVGDARATGMGARGELNVGQLARQRYGEPVLPDRSDDLRGRGHRGDRLGWRSRAQAGPAGARDAATRRCSTRFRNPSFWFPPRTARSSAALRRPRLERAIGVIYRPETERQSHYFDAVTGRASSMRSIHWDETHALEPLERNARWDRGEPPETFPERDLTEGSDGEPPSAIGVTPAASWPRGWPRYARDGPVVLGLPAAASRSPTRSRGRSALRSTCSSCASSASRRSRSSAWARSARAARGCSTAACSSAAHVTDRELATVEGTRARRARAASPELPRRPTDDLAAGPDRDRRRRRAGHRRDRAGRDRRSLGARRRPCRSSPCRSPRRSRSRRCATDADEVVALYTPSDFRSLGPVVRGLRPDHRRRGRRSARAMPPRSVRRRDARARRRRVGPATGRARPQRRSDASTSPARGSAGHLTLPEARPASSCSPTGAAAAGTAPATSRLRGPSTGPASARCSFDLLTHAEAADRANVFDVELLARRLRGATTWLHVPARLPRRSRVGYFGASTGAARRTLGRGRADRRHRRRRLARRAPRSRRSPARRGSRPDAAHRRGLWTMPCSRPQPRGGRVSSTCEHRIEIVPGATHLFEEPGTLDARRAPGHRLVHRTPRPAPSGRARRPVRGRSGGPHRDDERRVASTRPTSRLCCSSAIARVQAQEAGAFPVHRPLDPGAPRAGMPTRGRAQPTARARRLSRRRRRLGAGRERLRPPRRDAPDARRSGGSRRSSAEGRASEGDMVQLARLSRRSTAGPRRRRHRRGRTT